MGQKRTTSGSADRLGGILEQHHLYLSEDYILIWFSLISQLSTSRATNNSLIQQEGEVMPFFRFRAGEKEGFTRREEFAQIGCRGEDVTLVI